MRIGPKYKIARRLGDAIFPKTQTAKFAASESRKKLAQTKKRKHRSNVTEYGNQFIEKQKIRFSYGLTERSLANYVSKAKHTETDAPKDLVYKALERRLDNVIFRIGLASTRQFGRQMVGHNHITINGKRQNVPSYEVKVGDKIGVKASSRESAMFRNKSEQLKEFKTPSWIVFDPVKLEAQIKTLPKTGEFETNLNFGAVVQFYSRV